MEKLCTIVINALIVDALNALNVDAVNATIIASKFIRHSIKCDWSYEK